MANESTYGTMSALVGNIYELALHTARELNTVAPFVTGWSGGDSRPRLWSTYTGGTFATATEATDTTAQAFYPTVAGTSTPAVYNQQVFLTDLRIKNDPMGAQSEAGKHLGETAAVHIDTNLVGLFSSLTGGTVGTAGSTLTWTNVLRAQAYMRTNKVFGNVVAVLHPVQWYYLVTAASGVPQLLINNGIAEQLNRGQYVGSYGMIDFLVDANITSGTAAVAGMFAREAIYLDMRTPFEIEPQRDASRGALGGWELNGRMEYAYGVLRPTFGAQMIGTSA